MSRPTEEIDAEIVPMSEQNPTALTGIMSVIDAWKRGEPVYIVNPLDGSLIPIIELPMEEE